ncbi:prolipoprotein diacylglyceryl transferase [Sphingobacterium kitahiroshimense]|uniref:Phosphatidylglycerol--prolipoprotein diacylglyceryl transferase n=1 Tax=Sphingobacterium kitahiroshimense TaxID=470446 RepID=A0ABV0BXX6_9SPHI
MVLHFLSYINWSVDPEIFTIPFIDRPVRWYGLLWALGIFLSFWVLSIIFKKENKPLELLEKLSTYIVLGTMIGARLGHVLFYDPVYYFGNPLKIFAIWEGGLASHGGGLGIIIAMYLFCRNTKTNFLWTADRLAIVVPLAGCCIRLGNLMNSEMIGKPSDLPWAFIFSKVDAIPRHPAQLYEAIYCFFLFILLFLLWKYSSMKKIGGNLFALLLILLFSLRFIDEFFKINQEAFEDNMVINMGQILSIPFIVIGIIILIYNRIKLEKKSKTMIT